MGRPVIATFVVGHLTGVLVCWAWGSHRRRLWRACSRKLWCGFHTVKLHNHTVTLWSTRCLTGYGRRRWERRWSEVAYVAPDLELVTTSPRGDVWEHSAALLSHVGPPP